MSTETLSIGQRLMGVDFNPSKDPRVDKVKASLAEIADMVNEDATSRGSSGDYIYNLIKGNALRELLNAQMNVVKLLTLK